MAIEWNKISLEPYRAVTFQAFDEENIPIYHTDCVMSMLKNHVLICLDAVKDESERNKLIMEIIDDKINKVPLKVIELNFGEIKSMCSNVFNLVDKDNKNIIFMSEKARNGYQEHNRKILEQNYILVSTDVSIIEKLGGGSARCLLAEFY